jgi:BatD DUF11 like domain
VRFPAIRFGPGLSQLGLLALLTVWSAGVNASSIAELAAQGHLKVDSSLEPARDIVPGQKVSLNLKIATSHWFAGGTRIKLPEVPGLVILQTEQFASNSSENRQGKSWVIQSWNLDVFPQRPGDFTVGPITMQLKINAGPEGEIEGDLFSAPVSFTVGIPQALSQADQWVASPSFKVSQSFDRSLESLQAGDAFEREIVFEASDVMAMMLPAVAAQKLPGLAAYPSPPVLENSNNRGQTMASRSQRISYVVEAQGVYQLPALEYFWWDTSSAQLRLLSLPATVITVGAADSAGNTIEALQLSPRQLLALAAGLLLLTAVSWLAWKHLPRLPAERFSAALSSLGQKLAALRKPALPRQLNPGSSAGE